MLERVCVAEYRDQQLQQNVVDALQENGQLLLKVSIANIS